MPADVNKLDRVGKQPASCTVLKDTRKTVMDAIFASVNFVGVYAKSSVSTENWRILMAVRFANANQNLGVGVCVLTLSVVQMGEC